MVPVAPENKPNSNILRGMNGLSHVLGLLVANIRGTRTLQVGCGCNMLGAPKATNPLGRGNVGRRMATIKEE